MLDLQQISREAGLIAGSAGQFILQHFGKVEDKEIITKDVNSLVTYVDTGAEQIIVDGLRKLLPESGFLTEEETTDQVSAEYTWIIDPLDGTTNFLHGIPMFAVSIALQKDRKTILGIVLDVVHDDLFSAWSGGGAWLNGQAIKVSAVDKMKDTLFATGFPYYDYSQMQAYMNTLKALMQATRGIRRCGAAALDLAYVAAGRFDAFFEYGLNPWDVAGGALIVKEAGGRVVDFADGDDYVFGRSIIACSAGIYKPFSKLIQTQFS